MLHLLATVLNEACAEISHDVIVWQTASSASHFKMASDLKLDRAMSRQLMSDRLPVISP
jgi:hypothetical protein